MLLKPMSQILFMILICSLISCASTDESVNKKTLRKKRQKKAAVSQSLRYPASNKNDLFFNESGLDFLSKKLEDTISGYEGLQEKISSLEERLSRLIFLLEGKIHSIVKKEESQELEEEEESDDLPVEAEEVLLDEPKKKLKENKLKQNSPPELPNENIVSIDT